MRKLGRLDALVNNAAIADPGNGPLEKLPLAEWNRCVATNLTSVFLMTKHCAPHLRASRGAIVNIASTRAVQSEPRGESFDRATTPSIRSAGPGVRKTSPR